MSQPGPLIVALLFSGGDSPGMNALLRALVRLGLNRHCAVVIGVKDGYAGLVRTCQSIDSGGLTVEKFRERLDTRRGRNGVHDANQDLVFLLGPRCPGFLNPEADRRVDKLLASPYDQLSDSEKQYDRNAASETRKAVLALGYRIVPPG
jgi:hypothetical protein